MVECEYELVTYWIWKLCNVAFESVIVPGDRRSVVIVLLCKVKRERAVRKEYRDISLLSVVGKIYLGLLEDRVRRMTVGLI